MKYLVIDVESTGLEPGYHEIIQLGACLFDENWNELGTFLTNVYPIHEDRFSIPAMGIHQLSLYDLKDAPMIYDVIPKFESWILRTLKKPETARGVLRELTLCGQSVTFDINFLHFAYREAKYEWPFSSRVLDLHILAFYYFTILKNNNMPTPKSLSLDGIAEYFGLKRKSEGHNALEDSLITAKCIAIIMNESKKFKIQP